MLACLPVYIIHTCVYTFIIMATLFVMQLVISDHLSRATTFVELEGRSPKTGFTVVL